nr:acetyl-CoA decarbonylase/synthase complex subunit delta [Desulfobulbaceae bacterium]
MKSASRLEQILKSGKFAVTGELGPPKSSSLEAVRQKARILKGHVDAVNITDCQTAIVRMSSIAAGLIVLSEGVEPVIQMTCRDRNRIGMQSDILGASALGLKNLLCLTGDHQKFGNHPGSKGVFDMDSIQLLGMMRGLRDNKEFQCGEKIKDNEPKLFLGAAANPFAGPAQFRAARMGKKIENGADFIQTQIVYNVEKFAEFMRMARELGLHEKAYILPGVTPPRSLGMARYMKNFVPGMDVPDEIIERLKGAKDKEDEGINICVDIINQVKEIEGVSGVHVMAIEWESAVPEILSRAGLSKRPEVDMVIAPTLTPTEQIVVTSTTTSSSAEEILAAAHKEALAIVENAKQQALSVQQGTGTATLITTEDKDAGEHAMNEKERQLALESVRLGLNALKKAYGLSDDQFEALVKFAGAEAILLKDPPAATPQVAVTPVATPAPAVEIKPATVDDSKAIADAQKEADAKAAAQAKAKADEKAAEEANRLAEENKKAAEAKAAAEAKKAEEAKKVEQPKPAEAASAAPAATQPAEVSAAELKAASGSLKERAGKLPENHYVRNYTGAIRETVLGNEGHTISVGATNTLPFQLFEGEMNHKPLIALDVVDANTDEWPETLRRHFADVLGDPAAWAQKCVKTYGAEAICLSLVSTDPNGIDRSSSEAAKTASAVINAVDVPLIIWGCGNSDKDTDTLREITSTIGDKKVCLAPLSDANYRSLGATAMAFNHPMVAASPIDVNLAKQLNILLENLGVSLNNVMMDPSVGALGYGIEYTYSVMERIRIAALTQQDEKLQVPFICNLGREVWKAKECRLPSDNLLGDQEKRGVMMEAITAACMLLCGGDLLIMRHPHAMNLAKSLIKGLMS